MIDYFARHPTAANLLMLVFVLVGVLAIPQLQRETFPEFESSRIDISASYTGAPTEIVDTTVTQRIEDAVAGLPGIERIRSRSREGGVSVRIDVEEGTNVDGLMAEVKAAVDSIRDFPVEVEPPRVAAAAWTRPVASIAVTGPMAPQDLKLYCEHLKRELLRDSEISQVSIAGFSTHRLRIKANGAALARHGLGMADVAAAVEGQSLDAPIGNLEAREGDILVRYSDKRTTPDALAETIIKGAATGATVRLGDVAEVEDVFAVEEEQTYFNGARACTLTVTKTNTQDSLDVVAAMKDFIASQAELKPDGVELTLTDDSASVIEDRLGLLLSNGLQGLLLVFGTLWLFFGLRMAFWVGLGLPVSFLGSMWVMVQLGMTLNMMTMVALLVALGLLMDDAIVLADNIASHLERGASPTRAVIDGVKEVAGGVISSFITTGCVFIPLSSIDGRIGRTLQVIPFVLLAVLAVSLVEAFFILPSHLAHSLRRKDEERRARFRDRFDAWFARVREQRLGRAVDAMVSNRLVTFGALLALLIVSVGMVTSGKLRYRAFPDTEGDVVVFKLEMPPGTTLERTKREVDRVVDAAWRVSEAERSKQPEGQPLVRNVTSRFNYNPDIEDTGPHVATVTVDLLGVEIRSLSLEEFTDAWRKETGPMGSAVAANFGAGGRRGPGGNAIEIRLEGDDLSRLEEVSRDVQDYFSKFEGVFDLADDLQPGTSQVAIRLRPGAATVDVTGAAVSSQLRAAMGGVSIEYLYNRGEEYEIFAELDRQHRDTIADLEQFPIIVAPNVSVPLGAIATIEADRSYAKITRIDGNRTVTVTGNLNREVANAAALMRSFQSDAVPELEAKYPGVRYALGGEAEDSAETLGSMGRGLILGLFGIFVLLSLQFRSYVEPLVVMLAIPCAFVGVVWGYLAIGSPLSSQSLLGFVSLAGVVVNDSILLIVFIKAARARGMPAEEAARQGSRDRFRAVTLTSLTTIAGLIPLMFETSRQAQSLIPVATSIVFGMTASTLLVLLALPAVYVQLADFGLIPDPEAETTEDASAPFEPTNLGAPAE